MTSAGTRERYSFANLDEILPIPDLIAIQTESFRWFLEEGLANTFRDMSPIKDYSEQLQLELEFDPFDEDLKPYPKFSVEECKEKDMTYAAPIFVRARFMNASTGSSFGPAYSEGGGIGSGPRLGECEGPQLAAGRHRRRASGVRTPSPGWPRR